MMKGRKMLALLAILAAASAAGGSVFANCQSEGPYPVLQCASRTWFAAPPAGSGPITGWWWAVGYGNRAVVGTSTGDPAGNGQTPQIGTNGISHGIDSGTLPVYDAAGGVSLDLVDATTIPGIGAPPGSRCFSSRANWGSPGIDSCSDVNRTASAPGGAGSASDNYVNRYWDAAPTPAGYPETYVYLSHQLDPPMGVVLQEGSGKYFAAAFFTSEPKIVPRDADLAFGQYDMARIVNGGNNALGQPNVVPWQPIPKGNVTAVLSNPADPASPRNVAFDWSATPIMLIHDGSDRPCMLNDNTTPCPVMTDPDGAGPKVPGVGVMNYGTLIRHDVESAALIPGPTPSDPATCDAVWTPVAGSRVDYPATHIQLTGVAPHTCLRVRTTFGKDPEAAYITSPINATNRDINRNNMQAGKMGDLGYSVVSDAVQVGGPLVSEHANLRAVSKERNNLRVVFDTDTELNVTSFDVVGIDGKGGRKVLGSVACKQCTTGLSASYDELMAGVKLQGAKSVQVVMQPSGVQSNTLDLK